MMNCSDWLIAFVICISKWEEWSLILAFILLSNLLPLSLCLTTTLAILIVLNIILRARIVLIYFRYAFTSPCVFIFFICFNFYWDFLYLIRLTNLNFGTRCCFLLVAFALGLDGMRHLDKFLRFVIRCDPGGLNILSNTLERFGCWV